MSKFWETGVNICLRNGLEQGGMGGRVVSEMRAINPGFKIVLLWIFRVHDGSGKTDNHGERQRTSVPPKMHRPLTPQTRAGES